MAVLTISGLKQTSSEGGIAIGIDLGTTHSLVAAFYEGKLQVIPDESGNVLLPSALHYTPQGKQVGQQPADASLSIRSIKRLMGRTESEMATLSLPTQYPIVEGVNSLSLATPEGPITPIEVSAEILKALYARATAYFKGEKILGAVITVPAYFDEAQRKATKQAAKLAGIRVIRLINEPTAAAIAYGLNQATASTCLVFDLGGGTFDISVLSIKSGVFEVLATGGDTLLGGDNIDHLIATWAMTQAQQTGKMDNALLLAAKAAKEALSMTDCVPMAYGNWSGELTRETLNELMTPLLEKLLSHCDRVLLDAHLTREAIDEIVLVGGATRMPYLRERVATWFGKPPHIELDPDQVVALGAALQADCLTGNRAQQDLLLLDVIPLSLGLEMMSGTVEKMILRNTTVPATHTETFTTYQDNQTGLMLHVLQGERELAKDCRSLARFHLTGLPPKPAGQLKIEVCFQVDVDGLLTVTAQELTSGCYAEVTIEATSGLSEAAVDEMIIASIEHADSDMKAKRLQEQVFSGEQIVAIATSDLTQWGSELLNESEQAALKVALDAFKVAIASSDLKAIEQAKEAALPLIEQLAERKLNYSLTLALQGKQINEVLPDA